MESGMNIVNDLRLLKKMEREGLVECHRHTGRMVGALYGGEVRAWYVDEVAPVFEFGGKTYGRKYFDGCFCPYVVELNI